MSSWSTWRTAFTAMAVAWALAVPGCGDDDARDAPEPALSPALGGPLPPDLLGAWAVQPPDDDTVWRTTLLPADHRLCLAMVRTRGACSVVEAQSGGGALDADDRGQPRLVAFGEVGTGGEGELVFRKVSDPSPECEGTEATYSYELRGDRLRLTPTSTQCPPGPRTTETLRRVGR